MSYTTASQITELTGQDYYNTVYLVSSVAGTFVVGETITGGTSGATSTVTAVNALYIEATTDNRIIQIAALEIITGGTSTATATVDTIQRATSPSLEVVESLITRIDGEINHILTRNGVTVPITSNADLLEYLKNGACYGVSAMVEYHNYVQTENNTSTRGSEWAKKWREFKTELRNKPELLSKPSRLRSSFPSNASTTSIADIQ